MPHRAPLVEGRAWSLAVSYFFVSFIALPTQTTVTVQFKHDAGSDTHYDLQWKEYKDTWEDGAAGSKAVDTSSADSHVKVVVDPLLPGTTYCFRLVAASGGEPGPELVVDTEQVSCTPQGQCCTVL